jgi:hypothetical protein
MADADAFRQRARNLLAQDREINDLELKEFRMNLEAALSSWEQRSAKIRHWLVRAVFLTIAGYLGSVFAMLAYGPGRQALDGTVLGYVYEGIWAAFALAAFGGLFAAIGLAATYFYKYAPSLKRARFDVQSAMILQLQEQIAQLRVDLQQRGKP